MAAFMARAVPAALRRLWTSKPVLANLDALVDHGGDHTDAATVVGKLSTAYEAGRGMMRRLERLAAAAAPDAEAGAQKPGSAAIDGAEAARGPGHGAAETAALRSRMMAPWPADRRPRRPVGRGGAMAALGATPRADRPTRTTRASRPSAS